MGALSPDEDCVMDDLGIRFYLAWTFRIAGTGDFARIAIVMAGFLSVQDARAWCSGSENWYIDEKWRPAGRRGWCTRRIGGSGGMEMILPQFEEDHGMFIVLDHAPNPDLPYGYWKGQSPDAVGYVDYVSSFGEASELARSFITMHDLGAGNWSGGQLFGLDGQRIGSVSYNGRVWGMDGVEIPLI